MHTSYISSPRSPRFIIVCAIAALGFALSFASSTVFAASQCKGKSKTMCGAMDSCSWVDSYVTKKGTKVSAFCRAKPGKSKKVKESTKSSSSSSSSSKKSTSKKSSSSNSDQSSNKKSTSKKKAAKSKSGDSKSKKKASKKKAKKKSSKKKSSKKSSKSGS